MDTRAVGDEAFVAALRTGDERAFVALVSGYTPSMLRVARTYVADQQTAEDVVQETWIALLRGLESFEGRSSLRTWLFTVLINIAKKRGIGDRRIAMRRVDQAPVHTVDPGRFLPGDDPEWPGHWRDSAAPATFPRAPDDSVLAQELTDVARDVLTVLPARQREVVSLRDMLGFTAEEVCTMLDISGANQRVLLHRGRALVRSALENYLAEGGA